MAIRSMTGYGRADGERDGWFVAVELRSVNHRGLDIRITAPPLLSNLEMAIRRRIKSCCGRGRVECRLSLTAPATRFISEATLEQAGEVHRALTEVRDHFDLQPEIGIRDLLAAGFALGTTDAEPAAELEELTLEIVERAVDKLVEARKLEGAALQSEFASRLDHVLELTEQISGLADVVAQEFQARTRERLEEILTDASAAGVIDDDRFKKTLVTFLDRSDITEEVVRTRTHATTLKDLFAESGSSHKPVGKRVDFFLQELIREANTMASKSLSADLTTLVVAIKVEIERMREQTYNIE